MGTGGGTFGENRESRAGTGLVVGVTPAVTLTAVAGDGHRNAGGSGLIPAKLVLITRGAAYFALLGLVAVAAAPWFLEGGHSQRGPTTAPGAFGSFGRSSPVGNKDFDGGPAAVEAAAAATAGGVLHPEALLAKGPPHSAKDDGTEHPAVAAAAAPGIGDRSPDRSVRTSLHARAGRTSRALQNFDVGLPPTEQGKVEEDGALLGDFNHGGSGEDFNHVGFPSVEDSTVMFLHVFKCAGSTLRRMLVDWAEADGKRGAIVHSCDYTSQEDEICLSNYKLIDEAVQEKQISRLKVLAGHFIWGFQGHVRGPYLMVTSLRNPLEVFVSAQQYMHRKTTKTLEMSSEYISGAMNQRLRKDNWDSRESGGARVFDQPQDGGFIRRFVGKGRYDLPGEELARATEDAIKNLDTFWIVGVIEQYAGFLEVLKRSLDPTEKFQEHWNKYAVRRYNKSPVGSRDVLAAMDPDLVRRFNGTLALQWEVYEKAVSLWDARCREVLPATMHEDMCTVPLPAATYR